METEKKLFNLFLNSPDKLSLYKSVIDLIDGVATESRAEENVHFWRVLNDLLASINNAGWEDRHSQQIDILHKETRAICEKYEDYLP